MSDITGFSLIVAGLSPNYIHLRVLSVYSFCMFTFLNVFFCLLVRRQHRTMASVFKMFDLAKRDFDIGTVLGTSLCPSRSADSMNGDVDDTEVVEQACSQ